MAIGRGKSFPGSRLLAAADLEEARGRPPAAAVTAWTDVGRWDKGVA
jgi:hypothetical protein